VVGPGATPLLDSDNPTLRGGHSLFEADLLPRDRTIELTLIEDSENTSSKAGGGLISFHQPWLPHGSIPRTMDIFQDGSLLIVDAPGHLPGHINLLARIEPHKYGYLAGDSCHDRRLTGEREISEWLDDQGHICCIHANKEDARRTIERIRVLEAEGVEIIFAHDVEWEENPRNSERFFG
jgi:glyoxylase-like metal-dependent hydrolase (beta-lactamase superfamily II)